MAITYRLVHRPWSSREPREISCHDSVDEAKGALQRRASFVSRRLEAQCQFSPDGMSVEISDDSALMTADYQGITSVESE